MLPSLPLDTRLLPSRHVQATRQRWSFCREGGVVGARNWYVLTLRCGCTVYVLCHPRTGMTEARIIEQRGSDCQRPAHRRGGRLWLWEILPERASAFAGATADKPPAEHA
jgi:hypothetical protein